MLTTAWLLAAMALPPAHSQPASPNSAVEGPSSQGSAASGVGAAPAAASAPAGTPTRRQTLTVAEMGAYGPIALRGLDPERVLNVGIRADEVVTSATLRLHYTYSPSLIYPLSHLKIKLNDEVVATLPLEANRAGQQVTRDIALEPRLFTDFNRLAIEFIGHYTVDHCEDAAHSALWTDISANSALTLTTAALRLPDNLALLPLPFFDRRDNRRVTVPFVLAENADMATLRAAGVVASWLGALADYRGARFPVARSAPAGQHAIMLTLPGPAAAALGLREIAGPTVTVMPNPNSPDHKLLVIAGRNAEELTTAANALVLGKAAMAGRQASIQTVDLGPPRAPYDAPNWAPVDRPVLFRELVTDPQQLQVSGNDPQAIRVNLRVPADLYGWNQRSVPLNLKYRYTAPSTYNDSVLNVDINEQLVRSYRLRPLSGSDDENLVSVPLLSGSDAVVSNEIRVPAFRVGSDNQMQFRFHLDSQKTGLCASTPAKVARAAIDPDSSIDFSGFAHYAAMPNLAFFANSGYPFTRLADLADTAVVLPDAPRAIDQEALLTLLGHMGRWTGLPALRVSVVPAKDVEAVGQRNLLIVGNGSAGELLARWGKSLPLMIARGKTEMALRDQRASAWSNWLSDSEPEAMTPAGRAILSADGPLAALVGFESPFRERHSVIAVTATEADRLGDVLDALDDPTKVAQIRGDLTVVRAKEVEGLRLGERYFVGDFPWYARVWVRVSSHPVFLGIAGILAGLAVALSAFWALSRLAARRNGG
ncbi:cellulose biosynthesis cyclic di-GMP-binding regulatory protein BcsB [Cupriavidus gilardii]|nr:cellulose biosynthesis cyclic di-GMP-binding regulatory protein BcsB [Cupriavidus gilardii]MCT9012186.1 cellulose biosynthesis cyclic di-GMP-binding regulatory protein BcsB [Cupriavidus gilardii]MCT9053677.1 cellulose biosynthesis cyclic di-GMP-binding regulatory protein BcsB [Cupriavidus gilardii]WNG71502.1 cellulose biosynthesis cyclic di-GMP-binding regulatory protein BcsB [Cupriavidus gilardii]